MSEKPKGAIVDIRRLPTGGYEIACCNIDASANVLSTAILGMSVPNLDFTLTSFFNVLSNQQYQYLIVCNCVNELRLMALREYPRSCIIEFNALESVPDLKTMRNECYPIDCPRHLPQVARHSGSCAMFNVHAVHNWLKSTDGIMRIVCSVINKFKKEGANSLNKFEWVHFPENILTIYEHHQLNELWKDLPEHLKEKNLRLYKQQQLTSKLSSTS